MADCSVRSRETTEIKGSDRHLGHCWPDQTTLSHSTRPGQRGRDGPKEPVTAGHRFNCGAGYQARALSVLRFTAT